jgi:hypothetical protein
MHLNGCFLDFRRRCLFNISGFRSALQSDLTTYFKMKKKIFNSGHLSVHLGQISKRWRQRKKMER